MTAATDGIIVEFPVASRPDEAELRLYESFKKIIGILSGGASGTFTAASGEVVTVVDGIITDIT